VFDWYITFLERVGDVPELTVTDYVTEHVVTTVQDGSTVEMTGNFKLSYNGLTSGNLDISTATKLDVMNSLKVLGAPVVNVKEYRGAGTSSYMWVVEFDQDVGNVPEIELIIAYQGGIVGTAVNSAVTTQTQSQDEDLLA
jgi:hypothetical protein